MKKRLIVHLAWTAFASPLLSLAVLAVALGSAHLRWLALLFLKPGAQVAMLFTPKDAYMPVPGLVLLGQCFCNWILLFVVMLVFESLSELRRGRERSQGFS
jgi:hypothetical protein